MQVVNTTCISFFFKKYLHKYLIYYNIIQKLKYKKYIMKGVYY